MIFSQNKLAHRDLMLNLAFFLILISPPIEFLLPRTSAYISLIVFGIVIFLSNFKNVSHEWTPYICIFILLFSMALVLRLFSNDSEIFQRPLYIRFAIVVIALHLASNIDKPNQRILIFHYIFIASIIEIGLIYLQFSYITYGIGISPNFDDAEVTGFITGSYGNANNIAVYLLFSYLILTGKNYFQRGISEIIFTLLIYGGIFITLSRTSLVILSIFCTTRLLFLLFQRKKNWINFILIAVLLLLFFINLSDKLDDNVVIERSISRLKSLSFSGGDESVEFRYISLFRLIDNFLNLGFGSLRDLNYADYFLPSDDTLMMINPHSFIVEVAFLFGYPGLLCGLLFFFYIFKDLFDNNKNVLYVIACFISVVFLTFVPSSILGIPLLMIYPILLAKLRPLK